VDFQPSKNPSNAFRLGDFFPKNYRFQIPLAEKPPNRRMVLTVGH